MSYNFDLLIIGAGPAGLAAAKQAAHYGVSVAITEQNHFGGCCVNRGCVPKKLLVYAADFAAAMQNAADYGWEKCANQFSWQQFRAKRDHELQRLRQVQHQALQQAGVQILNGHTRFVDAHTLDVNGEKYTAARILIAVGGKPTKPKISGIEYAITSDQMLDLEQLPQRIAIIGGGYIGVEYSSILRGLGCEVTVMNREACLLEGFDADLQSRVREGLMQRGIQSLCNTTTDQITETPNGLCLHLTGDHSDQLFADVVLCAVGRAPNLDDLGLETTEVAFDKKAIRVDEHSRTSQPHIYAVGDCTNRKQLTPVAKAEGKAAVDTMFGKPSPLDYGLVPSAVLSRPEAAGVGLTEDQAKEKYGDVECYCKSFVPLRYSLTEQQQQAFLKLVVEKNSERILGLHMVGEDAAEIVQSAAVALRNGLTRSELTQTIGIHPSTAEELFSFA